MDKSAQDDGTFSSVSLAEMARELGISDGVLTQAMETWQLENVQLEKRAAVSYQKQQQRSRFLRQALIPYLAVNAFLMMLNVSLAGSITWAIYPLLGWGLALCLGVCFVPGVCF
ncbi:MAG: 2TM domain-containing protein [Cyanobacteria bacterium J06555_13]